MPLLKVTTSDIQKSKILQEGWFGLQCKGVSDWTPSSDGKSTNMKVTFLVEGTDGKEMEHIINSKGIGFQCALFASFENLTLKAYQDKAADQELDTDKWVGKKVDGHVIVDTYQGRNNNKFSTFMPYGKGREQAKQSGQGGF
jgi:hypothetical protein